MKRKTIRKIAANLAFLQLFLHGGMPFNKNNDKSYTLISKAIAQTETANYNKTGLILIEDNEEYDVYHRIDEETGETKPIAIFDDDNIRNKQYGANQMDFSNHFNALISDPIIWDEMQKYYPVEIFEDYEEAMFFYKEYFKIIAENGCGYASATNCAFMLFEGDEKGFYEKFGFPMYTADKKYIDFNYEAFLLKFFNYYNLEVCGNYRLINRAMAEDMAKFRLNHYKEKTAYLTKKPDNARSMSEEDWEARRKTYSEREKKISELEEIYNNSFNEDINFGVPPESRFGYLYKFLERYNIRISSKYHEYINNLEVGDIIDGDVLTLWEIEKGGSIKKVEETDLHYVTLSEIDGDTYYVSSWGSKYVYINPYAKKLYKISIKRK